MPYKNLDEQKKAQHESYLRHKEKVGNRFRQRRTEMLRWFHAVKSVVGCSVCSEKDSWCIDLHHVLDKDGQVTPMINSLRSEKMIKDELAKCVPLCANCHRKHHRGSLNVELILRPDWYKVDEIPQPSFWKL